MSDNKYKSLFTMSLVSALILVAINILLFFVITHGGEERAFIYLIFVLPLTPFLSLPATAIVYFVHWSRGEDVFSLPGSVSL
jgi:hypothetical protein